ncbi:MAG: hypothetical protein ACPGWR_19820 [Ardenticatenaceae bacterium]
MMEKDIKKPPPSHLLWLENEQKKDTLLDSCFTLGLKISTELAKNQHNSFGGDVIWKSRLWLGAIWKSRLRDGGDELKALCLTLCVLRLEWGAAKLFLSSDIYK